MDKKKTLIALVALQCLYLVFSPFWMYFAMISTMMFDSPEAADDP